MPTVLIVDDDPALRVGLREALADLGHDPVEAPDGTTALAWLKRHRPDAVLLDLRMPDLDGLEVLRRIRASPHAPPVAIVTAVPTAGNTIEAMRLGAVDHLAKPVSRADLSALLDRLLPAPVALPKRTGMAGSATEGELVGSSAPMREVQKQLGRLADSGATILITGETGTGKEVIARALHHHGPRARRPFVAVNCAAIPAELLESELFGHVRGAFTGAVSDRVGSVREADRGTLFLDEVGDMAAPLQAKLLRVLQERIVTPLGGRAVAVDVRVVAATHRDLRREIEEGRFREDLYYRLGVVPLHLPPLRDRLADIVPLAEHFLGLAEAGPDAPKRLSADAAACLLSYAWPGNVRELRNAMERVAATVRRPAVASADLAFLQGRGAEAGREPDWMAGTLPEALARLEAAMIRRALAAANGNRSEAARTLGIHRQLLHEKIRRGEVTDG